MLMRIPSPMERSYRMRCHVKKEPGQGSLRDQTDKGKSLLGVDAFAPAASRIPLESEVNHPPVSFLSC